MGNNASTTLATLARTRNIANAIAQSHNQKKNKKSKEITIKQIYKDILENREYHIGVFGQENSGKNTLALLLEDKYTTNESDRGPKFYMRYVHSNLLLGIYYLLEAARTFFNFAILQRNEELVNRIYIEVNLLRNLPVIHEQFYLSRMTLRVIHELWRKEPALQRVYRRRHEMFFLPNWHQLINYIPQLLQQAKQPISLPTQHVARLKYHRTIIEPIAIEHSFTKEFDGHFKVHVQDTNQPIEMDDKPDMIYFMIDLTDFARRTHEDDKEAHHTMLDQSLKSLFDLIQKYPKVPYYIFLTHFDKFEKVAAENDFKNGPALIRPTIYKEDLEALVRYKINHPEHETCPMTLAEYNYIKRNAYPLHPRVPSTENILVEGQLFTSREIHSKQKRYERRPKIALQVDERIASAIVQFIGDGPTMARLSGVNACFFRVTEKAWKRLVGPQVSFSEVARALRHYGTSAFLRSISTPTLREHYGSFFMATKTNAYIPEDGIVRDYTLTEDHFAESYQHFLWKRYYLTNGYAPMRVLQHIRRRIDTIFGEHRQVLQSVHVVNTLRTDMMHDTISHILMRFMARHIDAELHRLSQRAAQQPATRK